MGITISPGMGSSGDKNLPKAPTRYSKTGRKTRLEKVNLIIGGLRRGEPLEPLLTLYGMTETELHSYAAQYDLKEALRYGLMTLEAKYNYQELINSIPEDNPIHNTWLYDILLVFELIKTGLSINKSVKKAHFATSTFWRYFGQHEEVFRPALTAAQEIGEVVKRNHQAQLKKSLGELSLEALEDKLMRQQVTERKSKSTIKTAIDKHGYPIEGEYIEEEEVEISQKHLEPNGTELRLAMEYAGILLPKGKVEYNDNRIQIGSMTPEQLEAMNERILQLGGAKDYEVIEVEDAEVVEDEDELTKLLGDGGE